MEWIKKHTTLLVVIIIAFALVLPICINALYLVNTDCEILHKPSEWTTFWGSYLGAIISAGVAFIILHIQRNDSEAQNMANKKHNDIQNKNNRTLQYNIIKFNQEMALYHEFCKACVNNISAYKVNELANNIINIITIDTDNIQCLCDIQPYISIISSTEDKLDETNNIISFYIKDSTLESNLYNELRQKSYEKFKVFLDDIRFLLTCSVSKDEVFLRDTINKDVFLLSHNAKERVESYITQHDKGFDKTTFISKVMIPYIRSYENMYKDVQKYTHQFIQSENIRINNILTQNIV